jgi:hypothetical protein
MVVVCICCGDPCDSHYHEVVSEDTYVPVCDVCFRTGPQDDPSEAELSDDGWVPYAEPYGEERAIYGLDRAWNDSDSDDDRIWNDGYDSW